MKKSFLILLMVILGYSLCACSIKNDNKSLYELNVAEVTHSIFYAPLYVAINNGYFKDNGLNINLSVISGANNVVAAVLSGDYEIGLCGPEATIYVYNGGEKDYIRTFAGLTKRDGQFLISRNKISNFKWSNLENKEVLAGRIGGMPELNFENALMNAGISKYKVNIDTSVDFASLTSAFISGKGDFVNLFEPNATKLVNMGYGYIVESIGKLSGELPYTAFNAKKSYIDKHPEIISKFKNAINTGLKFVNDNDENKIALAVEKSFPDSSIEELKTIVKRYKDADTWLDNTYISQEMFENLEKIMINSNQLDDFVPYDDLILN